ncbi:aquaporin Z [Antricoccus suffuscus]|uniref:Aquaporin Z n=1 Tax=Antricoccus suffuscus TaxID=1629062 RepID=A0A2T1A2F7_9ACTN|nr:aquaporin [Antricoccus suffuscus]PRZ42791.1 aquaporin Z [Antricoccus suffuscus]
MDIRKLVAEALGTALLVFLSVGTATLCFGFGMTGKSAAAGVVATALSFGLVLLVLAYAIGPISGCHINPAVTIGFLVARRISITEAVGYWIAQIVGGIAGAALLRAMFAGAADYSTDKVGLGTDGWGDASMIGLNAGGAFLAEVVLTFMFVTVVLAVTRKASWPQLGGVAIGLSLTTVHLIGIPLTGTSVNPARSIGPALFVGGDSLSQLWLFIVAPLVGGAIAALVTMYFYPGEHVAPEVTADEAV